MEHFYKKDGTNINLLQDTDIEYGSNERGHYIKYSNGVLIQWGSIPKIISIKNKYGDMFYDDNYGIEFPLSFIDKNYSVSVTSSNSSNAIFVYSCNNYTTDRVSFNLMSPLVVEGLNNFYFNWFAIGRWK